MQSSIWHNFGRNLSAGRAENKGVCAHGTARSVNLLKPCAYSSLADSHTQPTTAFERDPGHPSRAAGHAPRARNRVSYLSLNEIRITFH